MFHSVKPIGSELPTTLVMSDFSVLALALKFPLFVEQVLDDDWPVQG
jgi:hypothetical protein